MAVSSVSYANTPQAVDDLASAMEDSALVIDVMGNDKGGNAKSLYSVNQSNLLVAQSTGSSKLGATIKISNGKIAYDASGLKAVQSLAAGETTTDTFTYAIQLGNGTISTATVTVTIKGQNDGPVLALDPNSQLSVSEISGATSGAGALTATAKLSLVDADLHDKHSVTVDTPKVSWSKLGAFSIPLDVLQSALKLTVSEPTSGGSGSVSAQFSLSDKYVDFLAVGETLTVTYNVTVKDSQGATAVQPVTFTITGANDAPVISSQTGDSLGTASPLVETNARLSASGTLTVSDADYSDQLKVSKLGVTHIGSVGTLTDAQLLEFFAVSGGTIDSLLATKGKFTWTFNSGAEAFNHLAQGETLTLTYTIRPDDGHGVTTTGDGTVTIRIQGTNDAPVVAQPVKASGTEGGGLLTVDLLQGASDPDGGAVLHVANLAWADKAAPAGFTLDGNTLKVDTNAAAFDALGADETVQKQLAYDVVDDKGALVRQTATVTVKGVNDGPTITNVPGSATYQEAADQTGNGKLAVSVGGKLAFGDADLTDTHTVATAFKSATWSAGTVPSDLQAFWTKNPVSASIVDVSTGDGTGTIAWNFGAVDGQFDFLGRNETLTITEQVKVTDKAGESATQDVVVTVTGANDAVHFTGGIDSKAFVEATSDADAAAHPLTTSGYLSFTDVDLKDTHSFEVGFSAAVSSGAAVPAETLAALKDAFAIAFSPENSTGSFRNAVWSFGAPSPVASKYVDFLAQGETLTLTYDVKVSDGLTSDVKPVTITVQGTNDAPVISQPVKSSGTEGGGTLSVDLLQGASDADHGAALHVANLAWGGSDKGAPAGFALDGNTLKVDTNAAAFDALGANEAAQRQVTYDIVDDKGALVHQTATVTVAGVNDAPTISATPGAGSYQEVAGQTGKATSVSVSGKLAFGDVDLTDTHTVATAFKSAAWSAGAVPNDLQAFWTKSPIFAGISDKATGDGSGTIAWSFGAVDGQFDFLGGGETLAITEQVTVTDKGGLSASQDVVVTVTGANDAVRFTGGDDTRTLVEPVPGPGIGNSLSTSGNLQFSDADLTDKHTFSVALTATTSSGVALPAETLAAFTDAFKVAFAPEYTNGGNRIALWGFGAGNPVPGKYVDFLADGESLTLSFAVTVTDGAGSSDTRPVTITVKGSNDAPVVSGDVTASATAGTGPLTIDLLQNASDVDHGAVLHVANVSFATQDKGPPAGVTYDLAKHTLTVDTNSPAFAALADGQPGLTKLSYDVVDDKGGLVRAFAGVTVTGVNDAPVALSGTNAGDEDKAITGTVTGTDVDSTSLSYAVATGPSHGTIALDASGAYTYTPDKDYFGADAFTFTANDGQLTSTAATIDLAIKAVNDAPVAQNLNWGDYEDVPVLGAMVATDAENDSVTYQVLEGPKNGTLERLAGGGFKFTPTKDWNGVDSFTYTATDSHGAVSNVGTISLKSVAVNDAPVVSGPVLGKAVEDGAPVVLDALVNTSDPDAGTILTVTGLPSSLPDGVSFDAAKNTFTLDPSAAAYQSLKPGQPTTVSVSYLVTDGTASTAHSAAWTVTGTNDMATPVDDQVGVDEDGSVEFNVFANDVGATLVQQPYGPFYYDVDGDELQMSRPGQNANYPIFGPSHGKIDAYANGRVIYTPDADFSGTDSFNYYLTDARGELRPATVNIEVRPVNDAATIGGALKGAVTEDASVATGGTLTITDPDTGEAHFKAVAPADLVKTYGTFGFDQGTGAWTYKLDHDKANGLASGEIKHETLSVTSLDGTGAQVDVTVTGSNDAPVIVDGSKTIGFNAIVPDSTSYSESGFRFDGVPVAALGQFQIATPDGQFAYAFTGTPAIHSGNFIDDVKMAREDGSSFGVASIDLDQWYDQAAVDAFGVAIPATVTFTATKGDGSTLSQSFTTDSQKGLQTFSFDPKFSSGLASLTWSQDNHVNLDNLVIAPSGPGSALKITTSTGILQTTGQVLFSDADLLDGHLVVAGPAGSNVGTLSAVLATDTTGSGTGGQVSWTYKAQASDLAYLAEGQSRVESFKLSIDDKQGGIVSKLIDVTVYGANDAPVITQLAGASTGSPILVPENTASSFLTVTSTDAENQARTYSIGAYPDTSYDNALFTIDASTGALRFTKAPDYENPAHADNMYKVQVTATDTQGGAAQRDYFVKVTDVNETINLKPFVIGGVYDSDLDGNPNNIYTVSINPFFENDPYYARSQGTFEFFAQSAPDNVKGARLHIDWEDGYYHLPAKVDLYAYAGDGHLTLDDWNVGTLVGTSTVTQQGSLNPDYIIDLDPIVLNNILNTSDWLGINFRMADAPHGLAAYGHLASLELF